MKWLILIMLASCGKHIMPSSVDSGDSDGDQIENYREDGINRYIADFTPLEDMPGEISFSTGFSAEQVHYIKFSNKRNLLNDSLEMLTQYDSEKRNEDFFSEWSFLRFETLKTVPILQDKLYQVKIIFETKEAQAQKLVFIKNGSTRTLGNWQSSMKLELSSQDLLSLLKKEATLALGKAVMISTYHDSVTVNTTVKEKTYRVFMNDGKNAKVYYVSKELSFQDFVQSKEIKNLQWILGNESFLYDSSDIQQWWARELNNGDKVLAYISPKRIQEYFLQGFTKTQTTLQRINGIPQNSLPILKNSKSRVILNIRPTETFRAFRENADRVRFHTGGGPNGNHDVWHCTHYSRVIASEVIIKVELTKILDSLIIRAEGKTININEIENEVVLKEDDQGPYYQISLPLEIEKLDIGLRGNSTNTYVKTGLYDIKCDPGTVSRSGVSTVLTNTEGKLSLNITAYVEKID